MPVKEQAQPTKDMAYQYQVEQEVSVNAFLDVEISNEWHKIQVTNRYGSTPEKIVATAENLISAIAVLREAHPRYMPNIDNSGQAPASTGSKKPYEPKPVPVSELPPELPSAAEGGASEYFKDEFDYFVVTPEPDEKATVKFFKDNMKYSVGAPINKWKHNSVREALQAMGDIDPAKADKYRLAGVQYWTLGNEYTNQKGEKKRYKDFRRAESTL